MSDKKQVNIATPVVWAGSGMVNQFAANMGDLIHTVNSAAREHGGGFEVREAIVDVHSLHKDKLLSFRDTINLKCSEKSEVERKDRGMAHWWFTCVRRAFDVSPSVQAVLYYPIDVSWDDDARNTVVNPIRICGMLKLLSHGNSDFLVIGNYESSNFNKEWIEEEVLHIVRSVYPSLRDDVTRVRSEYWGITRGLFDDFENAFVKDGSFPVVADPSLLLVLYCLRDRGPDSIAAYDLGYYFAPGEWDRKRMRSQIERARKLVSDFVQDQLRY